MWTTTYIDRVWHGKQHPWKMLISIGQGSVSLYEIEERLSSKTMGKEKMVRETNIFPNEISGKRLPVIELSKNGLRCFICRPAYSSRRSMEKHPRLPSPHQPSIPIAPYHGSKNLLYRAARESVTTTNTLPNNSQKFEGTKKKKKKRVIQAHLKQQ